jgi:prepilin-type N-terminal cleavage/methylation domain-containing protein/prepilin-type processing-associated H-X9-DG protein
VVPARLTQTAKGFTLVELITVVFILGILAAGVVSASHRTLNRTRSVGCLSNLKQWGVATFLHATDHQDQLPYDGAPNGISTRDAWYVDLPTAIGIPAYPQEGSWRTNASVPLPVSIWLCPSNRRRSNGRILFHYCLNRRVNGTGQHSRQLRLGAISEPSTLIWMFDNGRVAAVAAENNAGTNNHGSGAHFLFLDGHSQWLRNVAYWDFKGRRALTESANHRWSP